MSNDNQAPNVASLEEALRHLQWGDGLTRDEMKNQSRALRQGSIDCLPEDYRFANADSVLSYLEHVEDEGTIDVAAFPPPEGYSDRAKTGLTIPVHNVPPSVGSGAGSGSTGSSAQTGVGRWGTAEEETDPD